MNRIKSVGQVDLYGTGLVESLLEVSVFKFQSLGIVASRHTNINEHAIQAKQNRGKSVALLVSVTGKNETILSTASFLKNMGIYTLGIGGDSYSDLKELCDDYIPVSTESSILSMEVLAPTITINYVLDLIYAGLLISDYDNQIRYAKQVIQHNRYQ